MQMIALYAIAFLNIRQVAAWYAPPIANINRWHVLLGSTTLSLSSGEEACSANPKLTTLDDTLSAIPKALMRKPKAGDIVTFTLHRFHPTNNQDIEPLFDSSGTLQMVQHSGHYLPSLHSLLSTMSPGETVKSAIIDAGYGPYRSDMKIVIPTSQIGHIDTSLVKIGTKLGIGEVEYRITDISEEEWICDANHILAGSEYEVDVTLESVEEGIQDWGFVEKEGVNGRYMVATFALGCFWGGELAYQRIPGVISTHVGYTQGHIANPSYEEVCTGTTGHTEAIRVVYDPNAVSYHDLVQLGLDRLGDNVYKLNQVGNDRGTQYRHGIYYHNENQKEIAFELLEKLKTNDDKEVMTEVNRATQFYMAEDYHQQYLLKGGQSAKKGSTDTIRCYG